MDIMPVVWAVLGILLIASEFFVPGFVIFFFGLGALISAFISAFDPVISQNLALQIVVWLVSSVGSLFALRRLFSKIFKGREIKEHDEDELDSGQTAEVVDDITPDKPGRIRFHGTTWKAVSEVEELSKGTLVDILRKDGISYHVTKSLHHNQITDESDSEELK